MQHKTLLFSRISYLIAGFFFLNTAVSIAQSIQKAAFVSTSSGVGLDLRLRNKKGVPDFAAGINSGSAFINMGTHYALDAKVLFGKTHSFLLGFNLNAATDDDITVRRYADGEPFIAQRFLYDTHLSPLLGYRYQSAQKRVFVEGFVSPIGFEIASNKPYLREFPLGVPLFDLRLGFNMDRMDENGDKIANSAYFDADTSRKISVQHSIYLQNPILLGYDVRVHGLWRHDLAFTLNGFKSFGENFNDFTNANLSATVLLGKGNTPFEVGLNLAYTRNVGRIAVSPLGPYTNYIDTPKTDFTIGLPLGIRYQSAKGGLFLKIFATPYLYLNHRQYFAVNAVSELRTLNYENSFFSQVQGQVAIGYSFKK